jgi:hypothetical protein
MGDNAVIIEGVDSDTAREALYSTVHGAGRVMSRTAAKGKFVNEGGKRIRKEGLVRHDAMMKWLHKKTSCSVAVTSMKRRRLTAACPRSSTPMLARSESCTRCARWVWQWQAATFTIHSKTKQ